MAITDPPITYARLIEERTGFPTRYFYQFLLDLWVSSGGSTGGDGGTPPASGGATPGVIQPTQPVTSFHVETAVDYTVTGDFDLETVITTNGAGTSITVLMPALYEGAQVEVVRQGLGSVTLDGNGSNLAGLATQTLPMQYDAANLVGISTEWVLV